ncbi:MAG: hypothetical protein ACTSSF_00350 [Candidatus Heimdallarchaeaceae archaeon]
MLNKYNLQIANLLEKESDYSSDDFDISQVIKVTKEKTVVTDRYLLIEVTRPNLPYEEYPETGLEYKQERDFYLSKNEVTKIRKLIPKSPLPILENVMVSQKEDKTILVTTDLDNVFTMSIKNKDISYPDTDKAYPKENPIITLTVNAKLLKEIATQVEKFNDEKNKPVTISIYQDEYNKFIKFEVVNTITEQKMKGLLVCLDEKGG